jgi:hypothetical protein
MTACGTKRTYRDVGYLVAFGRKADISQRPEQTQFMSTRSNSNIAYSPQISEFLNDFNGSEFQHSESLAAILSPKLESATYIKPTRRASRVRAGYLQPPSPDEIAIWVAVQVP